MLEMTSFVMLVFFLFQYILFMAWIKKITILVNFQQISAKR